jgi:hypothetical protein
MGVITTPLQECQKNTLSAISTHRVEIPPTHTSVILTWLWHARVWFIHAECNIYTQYDFDRHECDFNTLESDFNTQKIDFYTQSKINRYYEYDTNECDLYTLECDFYTQSVISTRSVISTHECDFYKQSVIWHV